LALNFAALLVVALHQSSRARQAFCSVYHISKANEATTSATQHSAFQQINSLTGNKPCGVAVTKAEKS